MDLRTLIGGFLLYFLLPLWVLAGVADYLCHRRTDIERTSGLPESVLHVTQAAQIGIPLLAGLFLEINTLVLAVMIVCVVAHTFTALWDTSYSTPRRYISPFEQHVHSHLEYIPIVAVSLVVLLHWNAFIAPFGRGPEPASFALQAKTVPLPPGLVALVLLLVFGAQGVLLLEETVRSWRARKLSSPSSSAAARAS